MKTGMDFRGLVWKRVWKITFFGLKSGRDLKNQAAHPHQEFPGVTPPPAPLATIEMNSTFYEIWNLKERPNSKSILISTAMQLVLQNIFYSGYKPSWI